MVFLGGRGWFLPPGFPAPFSKINLIKKTMATWPPISVVSAPSFPPPPVSAVAFVSPSPAISDVAAPFDCQVGPTFPLVTVFFFCENSLFSNLKFWKFLEILVFVV
jgi:hypothetical protein